MDAHAYSPTGLHTWPKLQGACLSQGPREPLPRRTCELGSTLAVKDAQIVLHVPEPFERHGGFSDVTVVDDRHIRRAPVRLGESGRSVSGVPGNLGAV